MKPDLNRRIAEKLGWNHVGWGFCWRSPDCGPNEPNIMPSYTGTFSGMGELAEYLMKDCWRIDITASEFLGKDMGGTEVTLTCKMGVRGRFGASSPYGMPDALALAAEQALEL